MLLPQVSDSRKTKSADEFKIDLKILSVSRKSEKDTTDDRIARLEAVCNFIKNYGNIGSVDEPDEYIADTLAMSWVIGGTNSPSYVYFSGTTAKTIIGLGGSAKHMIGAAELDSTHPMHSLFSSSYHLYSALRVLVGDENGSPLPVDAPLYADPLLYVAEASRIMMKPRFPKQNLEFLAKRLGQMGDTPLPGFEGQSSVILATPLYVAMAD